MTESKLRMKFGEHEFEAEGSTESVERQFEAFKQLVSRLIEPLRPAAPAPHHKEEVPPVPLEKIMRVRGRIVSLGVAAKMDDAVLLLLLGQRQLRQNEVVSGLEIVNGLRESNPDVRRADNILHRQAALGNVIAVGRRRSLRYRLSRAGLQRAEQMAREFITAGSLKS